MVGAVGVHVLVAHSGAGADHEGRTDLLHALAGFVDVMPALRRFPAGFPRAGVHELEPAECPQRCRVCRRCVVVDEHEERYLLIAHECFGVAAVTRTDGDDVGAQPGDLVVALAQLRGMLAAVQSTEMSEEHQDDGLVAPEIAEPA